MNFLDNLEILDNNTNTRHYDHGKEFLDQIMQYLNEDFKSRFRMNKQTFLMASNLVILVQCKKIIYSD